MSKHRRTPERRAGRIKHTTPVTECPTPGKKSFATRKDAKAYRRKVKAWKWANDVESVEAYLCVCGVFHLGRRHTDTRSEARRIGAYKVQ